MDALDQRSGDLACSELADAMTTPGWQEVTLGRAATRDQGRQLEARVIRTEAAVYGQQSATEVITLWSEAFSSTCSPTWV